MGTSSFVQISPASHVSVLVELREITTKHWIFPQFPSYAQLSAKTGHSQIKSCYLHDPALLLAACDKSYLSTAFKPS